MEGYALRKPFGFSIVVLIQTMRSTTVNTWTMTDLKLIFNPSLIIVDIFSLVALLISSYVCCFLR